MKKVFDVIRRLIFLLVWPVVIILTVILLIPGGILEWVFTGEFELRIMDLPKLVNRVLPEQDR